MRLNIAKTCVVSYSRKTNILSYEYQLRPTATTSTSGIKDLVVSFHSKLHFHSHVDFIYSECIKRLGIISSTTFRFYSLDCLYVLYFTLVRAKLEYASVVWNPIMSTDAKKLVRFQQKIASVCFYRFVPHVPYSCTFALDKLSLHFFRERRHHLNAILIV
jgi:hypothetical protein